MVDGISRLEPSSQPRRPSASALPVHKLRFDAGTQCNPPLGATYSGDIQGPSLPQASTCGSRASLPPFAARALQQGLAVGGESPGDCAEVRNKLVRSEPRLQRPSRALLSPAAASRHADVLEGVRLLYYVYPAVHAPQAVYPYRDPPFATLTDPGSLPSPLFPWGRRASRASLSHREKPGRA